MKLQKISEIHLERIAARNRYSETLLLFFGIHMANAATLDRAKWPEREERKKRFWPKNVRENRKFAFKDCRTTIYAILRPVRKPQITSLTEYS